MKRLLLALLSCCMLTAEPSYVVIHAGYYQSVSMLPLTIGLEALNGGYTLTINKHVLKKYGVLSCACLAAIIVLRHTYKKMNPKRRKRFCIRCLIDLSKWDVVDHKKIVDESECYVCSIDNM